MSLHLECPHCGRRSIEEFTYGEVPTWDDDLGRAFMKRNLPEPTDERWFHAFGCRRWMSMTRDRAGRPTR